MNVPSNSGSVATLSIPASAPNAQGAIGTDLSQPIVRQQLAKRILVAIDNHCVKTYNDGHRNHLGASLIGRECSRYLWYVFRWAKHKVYSGMQYRLFQRGHLEEPRFIEYLEGIGAEVTYFDVDAPFTLLYRTEEQSPVYEWRETAKLGDTTGWIDVSDSIEHGEIAHGLGFYPDYPQMRVSACGGHFGGSLDAEVVLPRDIFPTSEPVVFINEYKTSGTGSKFNNMLADGVQVTKHEHFCQMSYYGWKRGRKYGLYMMVNKNDDQLHIEVVQLDWLLAQRLEAKADKIITSPAPPPRLADTITAKVCSYCDMNDVCHSGAPYEKNCRSCVSAQPVDGAAWHCLKFQQTIPKEYIKLGCDAWTAAL